jgi:hypothetical protein
MKSKKYDSRRKEYNSPQTLVGSGSERHTPLVFDSTIQNQTPTGRINNIKYYLGNTKVAERKIDYHGATIWVLWRPKKEKTTNKGKIRSIGCNTCKSCTSSSDPNVISPCDFCTEASGYIKPKGNSKVNK